MIAPQWKRFATRIAFKIGGAMMLCLATPNGFAQDPVTSPPEQPIERSDLAALASILDEQHVPESDIFVVRRVAMLSTEERYPELREWVMPEHSPDRFRVSANFLSSKASDDARIVSAAAELIRVASQLGKTESLREVIQQRRIVSAKQDFDRLTLLGLIAMRQNQTAVAEELLVEALRKVQPDPALLDQCRAGVLLLADEATRSHRSSQSVRELVLFAKHAYRVVYEREASLRHLVAVSAKLDLISEGASGMNDMPPGERKMQWQMASHERAFEHGRGFPKPIWTLDSGSYRNRSNYGDEYLFFQSPLRGDYTVEGIATGFGYREAQLMVGGLWAGLVYNHNQFAIGDVRREISRQPIAPPLTETNRYGFIRTRVAVQNGLVSTWMNGRRVYQRTLAEQSDPWIAIRTGYRVQGGVDNLRISGNPVIPDSVAMVDSSDLLGWYDYYQPPGNHPMTLANWRAVVNVDDQGTRVAEITDPQWPRITRGSDVEHLLVYARPMAEDGVIEYEFWYEPEQSAAHPALGRTCFLLQPDGVGLHHLTDGRFERTSLRPDNMQAGGDGATGPLPLQPNLWNWVQLERQGDRVRLRLNGQVIYTGSIDLGVLIPRFGLFHFADQTALRVRNPRWTGDWPKQLPGLKDQQLYDDLSEKLAWTAEGEGQEFHHRFDGRSITEGSFAQTEGD
ncbi:MAG: DUF1583 domain-containing protein, partial [Planctomycetales bacterium]|nr:DUF1583 domain-containing protein [Planctomycetales bacterium]